MQYQSRKDVGTKDVTKKTISVCQKLCLNFIFPRTKTSIA